MKEIDMIDLTLQAQGFALPLPAINSGFDEFVIGSAGRALPNGITAAALNFFSGDSDALFHYRHALFSADFARKGRDGAVRRRDPSLTSLFMDSGGFGFISGAISISEIVDLRREALIAQEAGADAGVIVDVPTACIAKRISGASTFDQCLALTQASIDYATGYRAAGALKLLNMIQGTSNREVLNWYREVKSAKLDGFGFAGGRRKNISLVLQLLVEMIRDGSIRDGSWFHIFGTNHPGVAILLTALQRELRVVLGTGVRMSFDSSTSFRFTQRHGRVVTGLTSDRHHVRLESYRVPQEGHGIDSTGPWPFPGPLGDDAKIGDFLTQTAAQGAARDRSTDKVGQMMLTHQSVWGELTAIIQANRLFDMEHGDDWKGRADRAFPYDLHQGVDDIARVFQHVAGGDFEKGLAHARRSSRLAIFAGNDPDCGEDEER